MPVDPQGQLELASMLEPGQVQGGGIEAAGAMMSYRDFIAILCRTNQVASRSTATCTTLDDLRLFYQIHASRPPTPLPPQLPPASIENVDAFLTEDEVVTKDEAKEAFASVQESFASVDEEQTKMKEGLHGLASKIDEV